ncbi:MAG: type II toxin-antitoxin system ParD family antitoxin [Hyphomonadaceae bacterium]|nr:type II toxin-antitoxin system ParD family antitoxin [Hyphomonadaceae bacterium]
MATLNVSLPDQMKTSVEAQATGGHFASASNEVRDLFGQDQERAAIAEIKALVAEGIASGDSGPLDMEEFLAAMRLKYGS